MLEIRGVAQVQLNPKASRSWNPRVTLGRLAGQPIFWRSPGDLITVQRSLIAGARRPPECCSPSGSSVETESLGFAGNGWASGRADVGHRDALARILADFTPCGSGAHHPKGVIPTLCTATVHNFFYVAHQMTAIAAAMLPRIKATSGGTTDRAPVRQIRLPREVCGSDVTSMFPTQGWVRNAPNDLPAPRQSREVRATPVR